MNLLLPGPIKTYFEATNAADRQAFLSAFAADAVVLDEGKEKRGADEIRQWGERTHFADNLVLTVVRSAQIEGGMLVTAKADGDFDKTGLPDPCLLDYAFTVAGDKIKRLEITLTQEKDGYV